MLSSNMRIPLNKFEDNRGSLTCIDIKKWHQINLSVNDKKFTFRGMHYQEYPKQEKQIIVTKGSIIDFIYNLKTKKLEFYFLKEGESVFVNKKSAHGFLTLSDNTIVTYLLKGKYNPKREKSIVWKEIDDIKQIIFSYCDESQLTISDKDSKGK